MSTAATVTVDPLFDPFRRTIMRNLLRWQVGQAITCPGRYCEGAVLDARRAVGIGSHVVCTTCWGSLSDEDRQRVVDAAASTLRFAPVELLDGPALHGRKPVIPAPTPEA